MSGQVMSGQVMSGQAMNDGPLPEDELRDWSEYLAANGCLPDRVCRAVASGPPILGGFLPIPVAFAGAAERLAGAGGAELMPAADLRRVAQLNVLGWLQPKLDDQNRVRIIEGVPALLWGKWEIAAGA